MYRANETKPLMTALAVAAEKYNVAIICLRHLAKGTAGSKAIYRGLGSIDFSASARTELFIEEHPYDPTKSLIAHTKNNIERKGRTQIFSKAHGQFQWAGVSRVPGIVIGGGGKGPEPMALIEVALWLEDQLKGNIPIPSKQIEDMARDQGFKSPTLVRAKKLIGAISVRRDDTWHYSLPTLPIIPRSPLRTLSTTTTTTTITTISTREPSEKPKTYESDPNVPPRISGTLVNQEVQESQVSPGGLALEPSSELTEMAEPEYFDGSDTAPRYATPAVSRCPVCGLEWGTCSHTRRQPRG